MDVKIKLSELLKDLADRRKRITNISRLNEEELKQLLDKCSSSSFNMFVMDKNGNIDVRTDIKVPFDTLDEEDIISYSRTFIMDDTIITLYYIKFNYIWKEPINNRSDCESSVSCMSFLDNQQGCCFASFKYCELYM